MLRDGNPIDHSIVHLLWSGVVSEVLERLVPALPPAEVRHMVLEWTMETSHHTQLAALLEQSEKSLDCTLSNVNLLVMKEGAVVKRVERINEQSVLLCGKAGFNDVALDHPSCSAQHAVLSVKFCFSEMETVLSKGTALLSSLGAPPTLPTVEPLVPQLWEVLVQLLKEEYEMGGDETTMWDVHICVTDLHSTNGTFLNKEKLTPFVPYVLHTGDVLQFGLSSRQYVFVG
ncbi:hypothetical protein AGDE_00836 [Angomonas deanei]|nr:hypothetical protein AGDE_00836 [Angomonas deanei]|eukprot:EPY43087.1 hypothetical protein AGDE_00836 [Angomonas deanei]